MNIQPILAALKKHKIPAILIVLEIALACAVLCNAVFMIGQRIGEMNLPNAIDEQGISDIRVLGTDPKLATDDVPRNIAALRQIPGVTGAAVINTMPLTNNGWNGNVATQPQDVMERDNPNVAMYLFTSGGEQALGLRLLRGRFFTAEEFADSKLGDNYIPTTHVTLVTQSLAERLWPGENALGKQVWVGKDYHFTVVGVIADVLRPNQNGEGLAAFHRSMFLPISPGPGGYLNDYIVRSAPGERARVLDAAKQKLAALSPNAVIRAISFSDIRDKYFADTRSMMWMLVLVCVVMLAVTAFGIVGLTSFWVGQRRQQIGVRRAVGATREHIMRYFQTENFLLSSAGVAAGMILAFGINLYLMQHYQMDRMPWYYLPVSAIALWLLGQLAVLGPALRAARVPPVVAMRSV